VALRGRALEQRRLVQLLTSAAVDGRGAAVLLAGEPGIGKTALLGFLQRQALQRLFAVGFAKADEVSQMAPGAPVLQALRAGSRPVLTDEEFRSLASLYDRPLWLVEAIADLLEQRSQRAPLLIVVDDLQWADRLSRFALRTLMTRLPESPIVWALAARGRPAEVFTEFDSNGQVGAASTDVMQLRPVTDDDVLAIAADILGAPPTGRARRWLQMVGGNPFLAVQLAEGIAVEREQSGSAASIPAALSATIQARIDKVGIDARSALHLASVWGRPLDVSDAAEMLGVDPSALSASMPLAAAVGLISDSRDPIVFRHDLVRELLYRSLSEATRSRLHGMCAAHLVRAGRSDLEAAPHARLAARRHDPGAIQILRRAALECIDSMPRTAADLIKEAFSSMSPQDPQWFALGGQCAELLIQAQHGVEAIEIINRLMMGTQDADQRARLQVLAARALWLTGSAEELALRVDGELQTSSVTGAPRARLEASKALALSRIGTGTQAVEAAEAALQRGQELRDRETQLLALQGLGEVATNEGRHMRAYEVFHQLRTTFGPGFLADEITALQFIDRFEEAQQLLSQASRGGGQRSTAELPSLVRAQLWQNFKLAEFDAALADAQLLLDVGDALGNFVHRLDARVVMSTVAIVHGDLEHARNIVGTAEAELPVKDGVHAPGLILARARIAAAEQDYGEGVRLLKPLMANDWTLRTYWPRLLDQMRLSAGIAIAAGDRTFAGETVERAAAAAARNPGVGCFAGVALQVRGFVTNDIHALEQAVHLLRMSPRPVILATALTDHGALLLQRGEHKHAARQLSEAREIYDRLKAVPSRTHVQALLASADPARANKPHRISKPVTGWAALTDSEQRVARLTAQGQTNRATAETLGISTNTVSAHLRAVFMKMDVHSRVQLTNAMPPDLPHPP